MQQLKQKNVKVLTEKVLLLLNRGGKIKTCFMFFYSYFFCACTHFCFGLAVPLPKRILFACSNTHRLHRTRCSSFCRMFSPVERRPTSSTAPTWWWWSTSQFDKYPTFHLAIRWGRDTPLVLWVLMMLICFLQSCDSSFQLLSRLEEYL